jgi:hypothetical protein
MDTKRRRLLTGLARLALVYNTDSPETEETMMTKRTEVERRAVMTTKCTWEDCTATADIAGKPGWSWLAHLRRPALPASRYPQKAACGGKGSFTSVPVNGSRAPISGRSRDRDRAGGRLPEADLPVSTRSRGIVKLQTTTAGVRLDTAKAAFRLGAVRSRWWRRPR